MVEKIEAYTFLDNLRESGKTNMFGAGKYVKLEFGTSESETTDIVTGWMSAVEDGTWDMEAHEAVEKPTA